MRKLPSGTVILHWRRVVAWLLAAFGALLLLIGLLLLVETVRFGGEGAAHYRWIALFWLIPGAVDSALLGALLALWGGRSRHRLLALLVAVTGVGAGGAVTGWLRVRAPTSDELLLFSLPAWGGALLALLLAWRLWLAHPASRRPR